MQNNGIIIRDETTFGLSKFRGMNTNSRRLVVYRTDHMTKVEVVRDEYAQKLKLIISDSLSRKHEQELRRDDPRRCDQLPFVV